MGNGTYIAVCIFFSGRIFYMYFIDYAIAGVPSPPFIPLLTEHPLPLAFPLPQLMSMGHTYKFFGFYISYTILNLPLSIFYLPFMLLILCTFSPSLSLPLLLHVISISHTILNLPLSIFYLPFMLLIPCNFSPFPSPLPADNLPCDPLVL